MPVGFSFGECPIRIGTMHLLVAEGAVLEPRVAQIVDGRSDRPQCRVGRGIGHRQVGVALHAYEAHLMPRQHAGIRRPVRLVAGPASFEAHGSVLEGKGSHLIAVAFGAARFVGLGGLHLAGQGAAVRIVTIDAGHGAFGQAVFVRLLETGPDIGVAGGAEGVDLVGLLEAELGDEGTRGAWVAGSAVTGSVNALLRRVRSAARPLSVVIRGDLAHHGDRSISTSRAQVTVVDLHNLPDRAQRFVVGVTLRGEFARKERQGTSRPLMFVVLDELNKYAPRDGDSPIKQILLDVAERGRSLGVILIGAQQTASEVERRILANCAIRVAGRLDAAEAERPEYGYLPPAQRQRATLAKPGTMFIAQPDIPVPLAVDFPFPAWATRPREKGTWG